MSDYEFATQIRFLNLQCSPLIRSRLFGWFAVLAMASIVLGSALGFALYSLD